MKKFEIRKVFTGDGVITRDTYAVFYIGGERTSRCEYGLREAKWWCKELNDLAKKGKI